MRKNKNAFTLVELIVVIIILTILWTIAFISMQWYSATSRDSVRITDIKTMKIWLELYHLQVWSYPNPSDATPITYSWWIIWNQWTFWESVIKNLSKINEKPVDPLTEVEYTYSVINSKQEFELAWTMEWGIAMLNNNILLQANARTWRKWTAYTAWNYNEQVVKVSTGWLTYLLALPTIISSDITNSDIVNIVDNKKLVYKWYSNLPASYTWTTFEVAWETDLNLTNNLVVYSWISIPKTTQEVELFITNLKQAYIWTDLETNINYKEIVSIDTNDSSAMSTLWLAMVDKNLWWDGVIQPLITQTICENAWWSWVTSAEDVYIWANRWDWFCISPRFWDWNNDSDTWNWWISWNGWWNRVDAVYNWWDASSIVDWWNWDIDAGQTRELDSINWYTCKTLWTALEDYDTADTIEWRMKWIATTWNNYNEALDIDWIQWAIPPNGHSVPALFLSDCIDWVKDLWKDMQYKHKPNEDLNETITYVQYNVDKTVADQTWTYSWCDATINMFSADLDCIIYQNRQKYLTAWTQKSWSHLPSAFSSISNWWAWTWSWEYTVACENSKLIWDDSDVTGDGEDILLSSIGDNIGDYWWTTGHVLWFGGCSEHWSTDTGYRASDIAARFVVRP